MDRVQKQEMIDALNRIFAGSTLVVVTRPIGMTVAESTELRRQMLGVGAGFRVTKNRLVKLALKGTKCEALTGLFNGPTAIAYSSDPLAAAKVAVGFAEKNVKLTILGGALGAEALAADRVVMLAKLPSLDELRARFLGLLNAPATRLATVLGAPASQLARVMAAYGNTQASA